MSINWLSDVTPAPTILVRPPAAASLDEAHAAIELWEHYTGKKADPTQRLTVEVMMAQTESGDWAAQTTGREMPRQNGKGDELEIVELWGLVQRGEAILHTIHDAVLLASQTQERLLGTLESQPDLRRKVLRRWKGTGQQMIEFRNGGIIWYRTRTGGGGRGVDDIDRLVIDEAQHATDEQLAAMTPTLFANSNPQMNIVGTAGLEGKSSWWWKIRKRALMPDAGNFGYVGHTAEELSIDAAGRVSSVVPDVADRSVWMATNPALHSGRGRGVDFLQEQLHTLGEAMFAQEHLCVWAPPPDGSADGAINRSDWGGCGDGDSLPDSGVRLALDATPNLDSATFAIAGRREDGLLHVSVRRHVPKVERNDERPVKTRVIELAKALVDGHGTALIIPSNSPATAWKPELVAAGVEIDDMPGPEFNQACGELASAVRDRRVRHRDDPILNNAVDALRTRPSGDVDVFSRRNSVGNIAPLVAAACALVRVPVEAQSKYEGPLVAFR